VSPRPTLRLRKRGVDRRPAVARLRRTRWLLTALFASITAACLIALGVFAATIDARSRDRSLDAGIDRVVTGLARDVYWHDDGTLDLETLRGDDLAQGTTAVAVAAKDANGQWRERFGHRRQALPADAELTALVQDVADQEETLVRSMRDTNGRAVRVSATPVYFDTTVTAAVIAGEDPAPTERDHRRLVLALVFGGAALVALAALAGHLLSGASMRPAVRMLDEQERFLGDAAHELRTPLTTLRLVTEAGLRDPGESRRALTDAQALADRMARLVTGLLARARTETGVVELEMVPLRLDQLVEAVVAERADSDVGLSAESTVVQGDPELLTLAVRNLIDNAIVHGAPPIEVTVTDGSVAVRDHGVGLDPAMGDPFGRGVTGPTGNHGIGLAIVRWVAHVHNGTSTLEPAEGGGTIATMTLTAVRTT
jgi:two-component system, OmpR family, sensor kinase